MMRKFLVTLACAALLFSGVSPVVRAKSVTITGTWSYDYTPIAACNVANPRNCISGFTFGEWNGSSCSNLQVVPNPSTPIGIVNGITAKVKLNGNPNIPHIQFCVVSNYIDATGSTQHSAAAIVTG